MIFETVKIVNGIHFSGKHIDAASEEEARAVAKEFDIVLKQDAGEE